MMKSLCIISMAASCWAASPVALSQTSDTIEVTPKNAGFSPDSLVGSYKQPQWTTARPFTNSRVYVLKEHQMEVELWAKLQTFTDTDANQNLYQQEIEYGFYRHLQFDLYVNERNFYNPDKQARMNDLEGYQLELRWALADWGQIWGNPTLYFEYHPVKNNPERAEVRLLLGDNFAPDWHWALNIGYETDLWGLEENGQPQREIPFSFGVSTTALCKMLSVGLELKKEWTDTPATRGHFAAEVDIGPTFQWRPVERFHLDFTPLWGVKDVAENVSPKNEIWLIAGWAT